MRARDLIALASVLLASARTAAPGEIVVVVSANAEWRALRALRPTARPSPTQFGEWFREDVRVGRDRRAVVFFHGGWGKIDAAASAQYAIDRWRPELLLNLGTCGGFRGAIGLGEVVLVEETLVYDIVEQMGDAAEAIADYTTRPDLGWTHGGDPPGVRRGRLISADRDVIAADVPKLRATWHPLAADWESGAIARVAQRNHTPVLILRGVSDLVDESGSELYGNPGGFQANSREVMQTLIDQLPFWLARWQVNRTR